MPSPLIPYGVAIGAGALLLAAFDHAPARTQTRPAAIQPGAKPRARFRVPTDAELRDSVFRVAALRGRAILLATR
ncbi:MAG TPA: hypothetical protein VK516_12375, partial [Gemmatimonadaceae bacterium]|nr:hypothetical protein [Gemmatimonadaceae bacterium]